MKLHKLTVYVLDQKNAGIKRIKQAVEWTDYYDPYVSLEESETYEVGPWREDHPLLYQKFPDYKKYIRKLKKQTKKKEKVNEHRNLGRKNNRTHRIR